MSIYSNKLYILLVTSLMIITGSVIAQENSARQKQATSLTIYNQDFALVRENISLKLKKGLNEVQFSDVAALIEPDSIILQSKDGKTSFQVIEQNYTADAISQGLLLARHEGQTIDFETFKNKRKKIVSGKIIRSGYTPSLPRFRNQTNQYNYNRANKTIQPIIEVDGKLQFKLPGTPLFPSLSTDSILKPTLRWLLNSHKSTKTNAELGYLTEGIDWKATYNVIESDNKNRLALIGWVTINNRSGKTFSSAKIKLMAGDINRTFKGRYAILPNAAALGAVGGYRPSTIKEKAFDEYHLYDLSLRTSLNNYESKQIEFIRREGVKSKTVYVYDGAKFDYQKAINHSPNYVLESQNFGAKSSTKVYVLREIENNHANNLGMPLPEGLIRFYKRDSDGQLEFTGENNINHTSKNERLSIYTGAAFDIRGERKRTEYNIDRRINQLNEAFQIKLKNHKNKAIEVRVVEHMYRWHNWDIIDEESANAQTWEKHNKIDSDTIEFVVPLNANEEKTLSYRVRYSW